MEKPTPTTREFLIEFWKKKKGLFPIISKEKWKEKFLYILGN